MESEKITLGQIVCSKSGRDKGRYFIVIEAVGDGYVLIADGDIRKLENPKKKKVKHLIAYNMIADDIKYKIETNTKMSNADLRKSLKSLGLVEQSNSEEV